MQRQDMRTLSFEACEERRRQVVGLRRQGWTYEATAEIHWGDKTGLRSDDVRGALLCPGGQDAGDSGDEPPSALARRAITG